MKNEKTATSGHNEPGVTVDIKPFGRTEAGEDVLLYVLKNSGGVEAGITTYGGIVVYLKTPDRDGNPGDVVLGYNTLAEYEAGSPYFGAMVGRYCNRIAGARFRLDGVEYTLAKNNGPNHLHGGLKGFDKMVWESEVVEVGEKAGVRLKYLSVDMEEGYPGNLKVEVTYLLDNDNALSMVCRATTDKKTVVNLTNHTYFNLSAGKKTDILDHTLMMRASAYLPVDENLIPTGVLEPVQGTPFDFRQPRSIGSGTGSDHPQVSMEGGYDHCMVLDNPEPGALTLAAKATDPISGRVMELYTTEPGMQFYTSNYLDGSLTGKYGEKYTRQYAFCLETQHFPDSPNQEHFPSVVLDPGDTYETTTVWQFSAE